uniref:Arsenite methyltransferase n=1 Tax=Thermogemmatispora argillosa TaxID=2045280 RepID=A0A455T192_9CHLR|nr:arsenite S-adenosylmethyltransferase [Thermogemmatispora argillosa]
MSDLPFSAEEALRSAIKSYYQEKLLSSEESCYCSTKSQQSASDRCSCYEGEQLSELPPDLLASSCCCGNPLKRAELRPGETVLDLGCGTGLDVLLAARRVLPGGRVYGLDMNEVALERAEHYRRLLGLENVHFLKGLMEAVPLPAESVDLIISNCALNLAPDKEQVLREAYRLLKPGGRLSLADTLLEGALPASLQHEPRAWAACLAGAISLATYRELLAGVGFRDVLIESVPGEWCWPSFIGQEERQHLEGRWLSASICARKPTA